MAPSQSFSGQPPNTIKYQASLRNSAPYAPNFGEESYSDSEASEYEEEDESAVSNFAYEGAQRPEQGDKYMQDAGEEQEGKNNATSALTGTSLATATTRDQDIKVLCVCPNTGSVALVKAGACFECGRFLHTACCVRKPVGLRGFTCYYCKDGAVKDIRFREGLLTHVDETETPDVEAPDSTDEAAEVLESPPPTAAPVESAPPKKERIECVCPARAMKERKRLAKCMNCGVIFHKACRVRNPPDQPGFRCFDCPTDVGLLVDVPDRFNGKPVSSAKEVVPLRDTQAQPKPSVKTTKSSSSQKTHKSKLRRELNGLRSREAPVNIDNVQQETLDEPTPKRRSLRPKPLQEDTDEGQVNEASPKLRGLRPRLVPEETEEPARKRKARKVATKYTEEEIKSQYDTIMRGLVRMAEEGKKDKRSTDLHAAFLRGLPVDALWASYCIMADGRAANLEVREATKVHFVNYQTEPVHPVPEAWQTELKYRLRLLLDAAAAEEQTMRLSTKLWEKDIGIGLRHLQDIASDALHHGSYRGKRGKLGLLAEVLGLSEKGTFWKGGDRFAVSGAGRNAGN